MILLPVIIQNLRVTKVFWWSMVMADIASREPLIQCSMMVHYTAKQACLP